MTPRLRQNLTHWLGGRLQAEIVTIDDLVRHAEGFSWETYTFTAEWRGDRQVARQGFALRREPVDGLLPPYDAARDHALHAAVLNWSTVPMPGLDWLETDPAILQRPFYLMERVSGVVPVPWRADDARVFPDDAARRRIGEDFIDILASIHDIETDRSGITTILGDDGATPDQRAAAQVRRWAAVAEDAQMTREPILDAAVLWLERNIATSGRRTLVHGDYRIGNFMVGHDGDIVAVFDWELAHIGDPVFDLAWANLALYRGRSPLMSRLVALDDALDRYAAGSGHRVDREVLHFWTVFAYLRAIAPHLRAARVFEDGGSHDVRLANMGHQSAHLLKFLAEELGLRPTPRRTPTTRSDSAGQGMEETDMMQNTPERLLRGGATALREVIQRLDHPDPFVRSQLLATVELMDNLAPRVNWNTADVEGMLREIHDVLGAAVELADDTELPLSRAALASGLEGAEPDDLAGRYDASLAALKEVQRWSTGYQAIRRQVEQLLARHLDRELALLRAGTFA